MIVLSGAHLVLANTIQSPGSLVLEGDRIAEILPVARPDSDTARHVDLSNHYIVPGFIDAHVHGLAGFDALHDHAGIGEMAAGLPSFGVTAFCPTTIACTPAALERFLTRVGDRRTASGRAGARVLPAHVESGFINPEYRGAQPMQCLRRPPLESPATPVRTRRPIPAGEDFDADDLLSVVAQAASDIGIVTLAPELDGALALIDRFIAAGHRVSLGHSAATFEEGMAAIARGARGATHLFNRMPPLHHRDPGLAGAVLASDEVTAELVCDGHHVHPAVLRLAIAAKGRDRVMAVTDGTAGSALPVGAHTTLGGQPITVGQTAAYLEDGTLAGSVLTMDRAFGLLVNEVGLSLPDAATMCSTTPARELGLRGLGVIAPGATADLAVLDRHLRVTRTFVGGREVYRKGGEH